MEVVRIILSVILGLDCLALIVLVLMQQGKTAGLSGAIAGGAETFFGKKKASSYEGRWSFTPRSLARASWFWRLCCSSCSALPKPLWTDRKESGGRIFLPWLSFVLHGDCIFPAPPVVY